MIDLRFRLRRDGDSGALDGGRAVHLARAAPAAQDDGHPRDYGEDSAGQPNLSLPLARHGVVDAEGPVSVVGLRTVVVFGFESRAHSPRLQMKISTSSSMTSASLGCRQTIVALVAT